MVHPTVPTREQVQERLTSLHDSPVNTVDAGDDVLQPIFRYLMAIPAHPSDGHIHWFCAKADSVTINAATFLIRLFAYDGHGELWKNQLHTCITMCPGCVQGLEQAKETSRHT
jgi:senataxin